ncbi:zinc-finger of the MIZ type in Nse subunit-domain-containing protein [Lasiosphaeria miniovina]|uniref:peptidylprolyl isomerase n=1 Tax=Lasiosphaeria miniovina TaxID=1954250 RepID=A0AA40A5P2_9PEZI|nr:zinc-finger of the MIZ type in Nse subunit-domain-containing protein [Lasiosphaeria miniovina]KAK0709779.1 zinc-finger of the MIZ type in Nse subunit-domain-containing protein [Lasiosphaeria miniovina]
MPSLLQRRLRPNRSASASTSALRSAPLPPIEVPAHPINDVGRRALSDISNNRETRKYQDHLTKSATYLRSSVGSVNDVLFARQSQLASAIEKRTVQSITEKTEYEADLEKYVEKLNTEIGELTDGAEAALRDVIDCRAELDDEKMVLEAVHRAVEEANTQRAQFLTQQQRDRRPKRTRRPGADSDSENGEEVVDNAEAEDDDDDLGMHDALPLTSVHDILKTERQAKAEEYQAMSVHERYAVNNDYIAFKRTWHDALHPDDQIPLPDASTWFDRSGRPTKGVAAEPEDDDLVVEREIIDLKCPLSLQVMREPYSNHKCKHTFEKSAIMDFLRTSGGAAKCPVCSQELRIKDLYLDELVLRKLKRAEQAARRNNDDTSGLDSESDRNESVRVQSSTRVKKERMHRKVEDVEDDETE